jgi:hypothetical protein
VRRLARCSKFPSNARYDSQEPISFWQQKGESGTARSVVLQVPRRLTRRPGRHDGRDDCGAGSCRRSRACSRELTDHDRHWLQGRNRHRPRQPGQQGLTPRPRMAYPASAKPASLAPPAILPCRSACSNDYSPSAMALTYTGSPTRLIVPSDVAHGKRAAGNGMSPVDATLFFDV